LIGENIELDISHERDLRLVKADQGQLEQVIINLAVNARDAMPGGGKLTITTSNVNLAKDREHKGEIMPAGDYVLIRVSDTGSGIPPENLDRIFEPFFSTKGVGEGTGLGLATVYGIIKQSGGFVFVDSRLGEETVFSIYLPGFEGAEEETTAVDSGGLAKRDLSGKGTLLLVEDEDAVRSFGARALRNKGYNVLEANSGEAAVSLLEEETPDVDLVITDVVMPKLDGPGLVQHIREATPDIKVIFISGYTEDAFRKSLGEGEHVHFLPKPFSLKELAGKVKEVLEE
jgi:two-component system cell cycle sensor histidine kinase/response regulator CckA